MMTKRRAAFDSEDLSVGELWVGATRSEGSVFDPVVDERQKTAVIKVLERLS